MPSMTGIPEHSFMARVEAGVTGEFNAVREIEETMNLAKDETASIKFLDSLPILQVSELEGDCMECGICQETYLSGPAVERPARLPCGHCFGADCISKWVLSSREPTCPMCRGKLFEEERKVKQMPDNLQDSINLLERLVSNPANASRIMDDARRQTARRIRAAKRHARRNGRGSMTGSQRVLRDENEAELTATRVLNSFRGMQLADIHTSQPLDYDQWNHLAARIEGVRRRIMSNCSRCMGTCWDEQGPDLHALINPISRPLVNEYLHKLVQLERSGVPTE